MAHQSDTNWPDSELPEEESYTVLTADEVEALGLNRPDTTLRSNVRTQMVIALVLALLCWIFTANTQWVKASVYGACCSMIPSAVVAVLMHLGRNMAPSMGLMYVFMCEGAKVLLTLVMLGLGVHLLRSHADKYAIVSMLLSFMLVLKLSWLQVTLGGVFKKID